VYLDFTPEQHALRTEIRRYFEALFTPELRSALRASAFSLLTTAKT
jgi:hypothetical protein